MKAVYVSAVCVATAASFYGTAKLTNDTISQNEEQLVELQGELVEREAAAEQRISALTTEFEGEREELEMQLTTELQEQAGLLKGSQDRVAVLERALGEEQEQLQATLAEKQKLEAEAAESLEETRSLKALIAELQLANASGPEGQTGYANLESEIKQLEAENLSLLQRLEETASAQEKDQPDVSSLEAALTERDAQIANLEAAKVDTSAKLAEANAAVAAIEVERDKTAELLLEEQANVEELGVSLKNYQTEVTQLTDRLAKSEADLDELKAALAAQSSDADVTSESSDDSDERVKALSDKIAELTELSKSQDAIIQTLRLGTQEDKLSSSELAEVCLNRAQNILKTGQIEFSIGTTTIFAESEATLEELRDLAIGCQHDDLYLEVGGHTDSQGSEENNQVLSEARATAVVDFLGDLGVASASMKPVGYGETKPIETNDTRAGRAANRRITFEWKTRTPETAATQS